MKLLSIKEVAKKLGISERTVYRWKASGTLVFPVKGKWITEDDLERQVSLDEYFIGEKQKWLLENQR